ncbi:membrane cofactor protein-like isoform X3 [Mobula birostris]|uniref:membrane cofactor protein-like isoform X3 n=1 Tax=Mobula birostris TaxID=1983395 RepID=UPI003B27E41E
MLVLQRFLWAQSRLPGSPEAQRASMKHGGTVPRPQPRAQAHLSVRVRHFPSATMAAAVVLLFGLLWAMVARALAAGECNQPPRLENGLLEERFRQQDTFASGSKVFYVCNPGYTFPQFTTNYITCNEGVWGPLQANCTPNSCGSPGEIMNGYFEGGNTFGSKITFYCNEGYTLVGRNYRLCEVDGWSGQVPTCDVVKCSDIPAIENGRISSPSAESWEYGMVATVSCLGDYSLIGEPKLTCKSDGSWNHPFPKCKDVKCPFPDFPDNVIVTSPHKSTYKYQDQIIFQCKEGYEMNGNSVIVCGEDNNFSSSPPTCTPRSKVTTTTATGTKVVPTSHVPSIATMTGIVPTSVSPKSIPVYQKVLYALLALVVVVVILIVIRYIYKRYSNHGRSVV